MIIISNLLSKAKTLFFFRAFILILGGLLFLMSQSVFSAQRDYLKQLEMEAEDEEIEQSLPATTNNSKQNDNAEAELITDKKQLIVDQKSFEKALKESFPESYNLYQDMNDEEKTAIYDNFKKHKRLYNSSVKIISAYLTNH